MSSKLTFTSSKHVSQLVPFLLSQPRKSEKSEREHVSNAEMNVTQYIRQQLDPLRDSGCLGHP